jgi:murein DD-endopeptidase MepM/ murein hydrolase activator NlpD
VASSGVDGDLDGVIQELRDELGESSEAMIRAATDLRLADAALPGAQDAAEHARTLLAAAVRRQEEAARLRGHAQSQLIFSTQEAEQSAVEVADQQAELGRIARQAYQGAGQFSEMSALLEAQSPADFTERLMALETLASSQRTVLDDLQVVQESHDTRTADLEQVRDVMAAADERAQAALAAVRTLEARARAAEEAVGRLVAQREAALAAARAAQAADDAAADRRETESSILQAELAAQARAQAGPGGNRDGSTVPAQPGTLTPPVPGRYSSPFGMRVHPITGVYKLHTGQDIAVACGTPVLAARAGVVTDAGWHSAYGWRTVISHGAVDGVLLTTTYNHQQGLGIEIGQQVITGEVIGSVGSTGYSTGCHLHFELYVNASLVDPVPWLR